MFQLNVETVNLLGTIVGLISSIAALIIAIWLAYCSPQARLAKIEITEIIKHRREEHYARIEAAVFRPLSTLRAKSITENIPRVDRGDPLEKYKLVYDTKQIEESPYYKDALLHLEVDYPSFMEDLNELKRGITQLNDHIEHLQKDLKKQIEDIFNKFAPISHDPTIPSGTIYVDNVIHILKREWDFIAYRHVESGKDLDKILKELRPIESDLPKRIEENVLRLGGYGIASGLPEDAFESIVNKINELRKDREFINKFIEIRKWHNLLIDQSEKYVSLLSNYLKE